MNLAQTCEINLNKLLETRAITTHFQPIISIAKRKVIGYEALSRGISPCTQNIIMPNDLFALAVTTHQLVDLDRLCREKALENYKLFTATHDPCLLFLNLDTAIIDEGVVGSGNLSNNVKRVGINPTSVVIEIIESKVCDINALKNFINIYKKLGFLIALDDVGNGHSNLDRIFHVRPDIIKIDRLLISEIDKDYYKQELFKALVRMAKKTGSLVVAEGIETHSEALTCLEYGADMLQGYYFSRPQPLADSFTNHFQDKINHVATVFRNQKCEKIASKWCKEKSDCQLLHLILDELSTITQDQFEDKLSEMVIKLSLQYLYILDMDGMQITDTIGENLRVAQEQRGSIFQVACKGTDQSLKDYYLFIQAGQDQYITGTYMSLATGKPCITYSMTFKDHLSNQYILCADFTP